jgi:osmoprotectant transport system ATP-binding protein
MSPANRFVEDFVGADRALKRLALDRVRDVDLWTAPLVRAGESVADARARAAESEVPYPLVIDDDGRPLGWLTGRGLAEERVRPELVSAPQPVVELDDILRDALSDLLAHEVQYGTVIDTQGRVVGVLSIELLSHVIATTPEAECRPCSPSSSGASAAATTAWLTTASARTGSPTTSTAT